jgi:hypothetical protein
LLRYERNELEDGGGGGGIAGKADELMKQFTR